MRLFGTDGIRGEVGKYPLTAENILKNLQKSVDLNLRTICHTPRQSVIVGGGR